MTSTQIEPKFTKTDPLEHYASYPFDTDQVYQQGLASILANGALANGQSPEEQEETIRRTRVFYFNKTTGNSITIDEARAYEQSIKQQDSSPKSLAEAAETTVASAQSQGGEEPRVLSFAELKELIETGRLDQIPNNKVIPSALNEAAPSQSTAQARKKPWEVASEGQGTTASVSKDT